MTRIVTALLLLSSATSLSGEQKEIDVSGFDDVVHHWNDKYGRDRQDELYSPDQFIEIADNIVNFQVEDGGWPKSFNPLAKVPESELRALLGRSLQRSTFDNRTTYPHIAYLAKVYVASGQPRFKAAAERGLDYIFREQRMTGGWRGADVDAITFNDGVMIGVMRLLRDIQRGHETFEWLDEARRGISSTALQRAIDVTLKCQIVVNRVKTAWCQQHSHDTFEPVKARSYELPAVCPVESTEIVRFLMELENPTLEIVEAIEAAVAWIDQAKLTGIRVKDIEIEPVRFENHTATRDRVVVDDRNAPPIWSRFYEIDSNRPFFCNRDGTKVYSLAEVHLERRTGYGWYSGVPRRLIEKDYPAWKAKTSLLSVGIATADITPPLGYPMSGYYYERGATGVLDPLHAKSIVFDDGQTKVAIVVCDLIGISTDLCQLVRERASQRTKIPSQNIMVTATHCHTAPDYYADFRRFVTGTETDETERSRYPERLVSGIVSAVEKAAAALSPASLSAGAGREETVSFNRRFITSDGSIRTWANFQDPSVVRAAGPIDPALDIILIKDAANQKLRGSIAAFALHLDTTGGSQFSADFPFHMERALQTKLGSGFVSVFAAGTCGDINHVNPRSKDRNRPHVIGSRLGEAFASAVDSLQEVSPLLRVKHRVVKVPMKTFRKDELDWATDVIAKDKAGEKLPFLEEVSAYNIRLLSLLRNGAGTENDGGQGWGTSANLVGIGKFLPVEVQVIQLGQDTAVVGLPGEVFVELGLAIKQASPYRHTMVIELANSDESGYIPTQLAYQGGGYEVINSVFQPGGGEQLVATAIELLRAMKAEALNESD